MSMMIRYSVSLIDLARRLWVQNEPSVRPPLLTKESFSAHDIQSYKVDRPWILVFYI